MLFASQQSEATSQLPLAAATTTTIKKWVSKMFQQRGRVSMTTKPNKQFFTSLLVHVTCLSIKN
jgi:hypothetical protein